MQIIGKPRFPTADPALDMELTRTRHMTTLKTRVRNREYEVDPAAVAEALMRRMTERSREAQVDAGRRATAVRCGATLTSH